MTGSDGHGARYVCTNYVTQASAPPSEQLAFWWRLIKEHGSGDSVVIHVIDGKSGLDGLVSGLTIDDLERLLPPGRTRDH